VSQDLGAWLDDPRAVRDQYSSEVRLADRASLYAEIDGPEPADVAFDAVAEARPTRVLEVGCGTGWFSARVQEELGADVVAIDQSERMVELARSRGVDAHVGDVQELPFVDDEFDCAAANWMLYHVPALDRGVAELARVLGPGGRLIAVTNGRDHLREVWDLLGAEEERLARRVAFSAENGAVSLGRHFATVESRDAGGTVMIRTPDAIARYLRSIEGWAPLAERLPKTFDAPLVATRATTVFVATT
jgi:SAM-dependent methyltransferase